MSITKLKIRLQGFNMKTHFIFDSPWVSS